MEAAIAADRSWLDRLDFRAWTWRLAPVAAALLLVTWVVLRGTGSATTDTPAVSAGSSFDGDLPVAVALWDDSVSESSLLSLMLRASANDRLADSLKER